MLEDDRYRASTQYRYWSYTPQKLAALRENTNAVASDRVRAAIRRTRESKNGDSNTVSGEPDIDCLSVEEESKIVRWGCHRILDVSGAIEPPLPFHITATAIQYLRRFYVMQSVMNYHPKQIMLCALFLATKADHYHMSLSRFVSNIPKMTEEDVKAPEFLLMQGLRFTLDVRHPLQGLEGGILELRAMTQGGANSTEFKRFVHEKPSKETEPKRRVDAAEYYAKKYLMTNALLTDAYFLYTPSQMWLAALSIADEDLTHFYLDTKEKALGPALATIRPRIEATLKSCAELLRSYVSPEEDPTEDKEIKKIGKKLKICQNPEKLDLVEINKAQKRESGEGSDAEKALKKRKLEREKLEKDGGIFGGDLKKG